MMLKGLICYGKDNFLIYLLVNKLFNRWYFFVLILKEKEYKMMVKIIYERNCGL